MEIANRIFSLRKCVGLNQESFGKRIGVTRSAVCNYENGSRSIGEQVILSICREFNVSEEWLRTGKGEMLVPKEEDALDELVKQYGLSDGDHMLIEKFLKLKSAERQAVIAYMQDVVSALNSGAAYNDPVAVAKNETTSQAEPDLAAKVAALERQNKELAAEIAALKEEDELNWPSDTENLA
ncbi:MAG: helix-turn-helix domain-containing protein [Oscillospiraceae bacterium]|nr:helix-turn-helix domain-containing protein [Oscillospiraceae bacterium]